MTQHARSRLASFMIMLGILVLSSVAGAQSGPGVEPLSRRGWVNWEAGVMKAKGVGIAPAEAVSPAHGELLARRAAIVDGYRMLVEMAEVVVRRSETVLSLHMVKTDEVIVAAQGVVRGAQVIEEQAGRDGVYTVIVALPLHGMGGLGRILYPRILPEAIGTGPSGQTGQNERPEVGVYTGLIVVVRGVAAQRSMTPRLVTSAGEVVYGVWKPGEVDPEYAIKVGVAGYPVSVSRSRRGGARPLIIEAVGVAGPARTDIVIREEDALRVRQANAVGRFLERFQVDIVIER